jgi:hypothetical protein
MIFYTHERNFGCRITEYLYRGLRTIALENELLRVVVLADKGTDIFEFLYKPKDVDFMWRSPWGVRNPSTFVATSHTGGSAFLDFYEGGWQDCMPTGGDPTEYLGLPFGAHGETPTIPWEYQITANTPERIAVKFWVRTYRTPFYVEKEMTLERGRAVLNIREKILNEGRTTMHLMWGQHPALGAPFLDDSCVIDLAGATVHCKGLASNTRFVEGVFDWPHVPGKNGEMTDLRRVGTVQDDTTDTLFLDNLQAGWYAVTNTRRQVGFGMAWEREVFPALWFWQVYGGAYGSPWYGRTFNIALEPFSSRQRTLPEAIQDGSAHVLEPGRSLETRFAALAYSGIPGVQDISLDGTIAARVN